VSEHIHCRNPTTRHSFSLTILEQMHGCSVHVLLAFEHTVHVTRDAIDVSSARGLDARLFDLLSHRLRQLIQAERVNEHCRSRRSRWRLGLALLVAASKEVQQRRETVSFHPLGAMTLSLQDRHCSTESRLAHREVLGHQQARIHRSDASSSTSGKCRSRANRLNRRSFGISIAASLDPDCRALSTWSSDWWKARSSGIGFDARRMLHLRTRGSCWSSWRPAGRTSTWVAPDWVASEATLAPSWSTSKRYW